VQEREPKPPTTSSQPAEAQRTSWTVIEFDVDSTHLVWDCGAISAEERAPAPRRVSLWRDLGRLPRLLLRRAAAMVYDRAQPLLPARPVRDADELRAVAGEELEAGLLA
jgi:hypothetical protein